MSTNAGSHPSGMVSPSLTRRSESAVEFNMKTSTGRYEPTDADVVDAIALMLGTTREWDSSMLEQVAETVGRVRPSAPLSDAEDDVFEQFVDGILDRVAYSPTRLAWLDRSVADYACDDASIGGPR